MEVTKNAISVDQIATELGVRPETVRRWIHNKELAANMPFGRKGGYRVRPESYERFKRDRELV